MLAPAPHHWDIENNKLDPAVVAKAFLKKNKLA